MKKFVVERNLPGASNLSREEVQNLSQDMCDVSGKMEKPYYWIESFITDDKIYCIHIAENEEAIREHSRRGKFPINTIAEVKVIIDPISSTPLQKSSKT